MKRRVAVGIVIALAFSAGTSAQIQLGRGAGAYMGPSGPLPEFQHAISYRVSETSKDATVVLLSVEEVPEPKARDAGYLTAEAKGGRLFALEIAVSDENGKVIRHALYDSRGRTVLPSPEKASFTKKHFSNSRIEGQTQYFPEPMKMPPPGYVAFFNARTRQGPWLDPDAVSGRIDIGKKRYPLTSVRLVDEADAAIIVASSRPLEQLADVDALAAEAAREQFAVAWIVIEREKGNVTEASCFGAGLPGNQVGASAVDWSKEDWSKGLMRGRIASIGAPATAPCTIDLYFAVARN